MISTFSENLLHPPLSPLILLEQVGAVNRSTSPWPQQHIPSMNIKYLLCVRHYYSPEDRAVNEVPDLMEATYMLVGDG